MFLFQFFQPTSPTFAKHTYFEKEKEKEKEKTESGEKEKKTYTEDRIFRSTNEMSENGIRRSGWRRSDVLRRSAVSAVYRKAAATFEHLDNRYKIRV
jgi:hypothetical protein